MRHIIRLPDTQRVNTSIIALIEVSSGWAAARLVPAANSVHALYFILKEIFYKYGLPLAVISDHESHCRSNFHRGL